MLRLAAVASFLSLSAGAREARAQPAGAQAIVGPWFLTGPGAADYDATIERTGAHTGTGVARVRSRVKEPAGAGALSQAFRGDSIRGRRLSIAAWVRTEKLVGGTAYLYVSVSSVGFNANAYANSRMRGISGTTGWTLDTLQVDVPTNATNISVGLIVEGTGDALIDDIRLSVTSISGAPDSVPRTLLLDGGFESTRFVGGAPTNPQYAPARALGERSADAMMAFARLAGYVRFFHPSDSVVATDWHRFLAHGLRTVEDATTPDSLTRTLRALFSGLAPTMRIDGPGTAPHLVSTLGTRQSHNGVAYWSHRGVRLATTTIDQPSIYNSTREIAASASAGQPIDVLLGGTLPDPDRAERIDLGAGITAVMPVALRAHLPVNDSLRHLQPKQFNQRAASANDRYIRLAAVAELWMVMEHFYPYWDIVKTDWRSTARTALFEASAAESTRIFASTLQRMVAALKDGHGNVAAVRDGSASFGLVLRVIEGDLMITRVMDSTRTDIRRGDMVLEIDGRPAKTVLAERMAEVSSATPQWAEYKGLQALMTGASGSKRTLRVRSAAAQGTPIRSVTLTANVMVSAADMPEDIRPDKIAELVPGVLYVHMGRISDEEFFAVLPRLQKATGIVFDLRGYPSFGTRNLLPRLSDSTIRSARFEVATRSVPGNAGIRYRDGAWRLPPISPRIRAKVAFITDGRAISYAESTMGIVEAYELGEIVGEPTAGTNGNINPFRLPGGYQVTWTGMRVTKQDGSPHHGVGIKPTVPVSATCKGVLEGRDEQLEAALAIVRNAPKFIVP